MQIKFIFNYDDLIHIFTLLLLYLTWCTMWKLNMTNQNYLHSKITIGRIDYNGVGVRRIENSLR